MTAFIKHYDFFFSQNSASTEDGIPSRNAEGIDDSKMVLTGFTHEELEDKG